MFAAGYLLPGLPFRKGHDPRRNTTKGRRRADNESVQALARAERKGSIDRLAELRDNAEDEAIRLKAAELLCVFADGRPGQAIVITSDEDDEEMAAEASATSDADLEALLTGEKAN